MLRLRTCCRFCRVSLLWCANEKECNDSDGNRVKSSPNGIAGEPGPAVREREAFREFAAEEEADRNSKAGRFDSEGSRAVLMRRKPVSRSAVRMGDLFVADMQVSYCLMQARCRQSCEVPTLACLPRIVARGSHRVLALQCCPDNIYAPGQVIVDSSVHAHPPALRLRIRSSVRAAAGVGDKVARRSVFGKQQARGSAVGYCPSTRGLESRHAGFARSRRGGGGRGVYKRHRK
jgi:hypothetical protein